MIQIEVKLEVSRVKLTILIALKGEANPTLGYKSTLKHARLRD